MANSTSIESKIKNETNWGMHHRAQKCIAQNYLTNSKRPQSLIMGVYPTHLKKGQGCFVWDHDGKKYVDFITGLGTNLLGYANETVNEAVRAAIQDGNVLSLGSHHELETAELLKQHFPFVDAWKFLKTGTEACMAAVRIARAATGRSKVLSSGYHGHSDGFISLTEPAYGVPKDPNIEILAEQIDETIAAVIVEPVITDFSDSRVAYLRDLRSRCDKVGALLIFDEIITGFRFPKFSVSSFTGILPDLICLGKAMANGFPLAAVGGKYHVMNGNEYFVSSTYASCADALAACRAVCTLLHKTFKLEELWRDGEQFQKAFNELWPDKIWIEGYPTRGIFRGDEMARALFMQEACYAGILFGPSPWYNFPLSKIGMDLIPTLREVIDKIRRGGVELKGLPPQSPFAQKVREQQ